MRLIDKDKLLEELAERIASGTLQSFEELGDEIEDMEEVDAIPVKKLKALEMSYKDNDGTEVIIEFDPRVAYWKET